MGTEVVTSALSLARLLWWYGEDELWPKARALEPIQVADLADEFGRLRDDPAKVARVWPDAPRDAYLVLPVIELLEGRARPAARRRKRPRKLMPAELALSKDERWADPGLAEVSRILIERQAAGPSPAGWLRKRIRRWRR